MRAKPAGAGAGQALTLLLPCCLAAAVAGTRDGGADRGLVVLAGLIGVATLVVLARLTLTRRSVGPGAPEAPEPAGTAGTAGTADERQDQADEARKHRSDRVTAPTRRAGRPMLSIPAPNSHQAAPPTGLASSAWS